MRTDAEVDARRPLGRPIRPEVLVELGELLRLLRRQRIIAVVVLLLGLVATGYATVTPANEYKASATVSAEPTTLSGAGANVQVVTFLMPTLQAQVQTDAFAAAVRQRLPKPLAGAHYKVSTSVGSGTGLLTISITSHNRLVVAPVADGYAASLIAANPSRAITLHLLSPAHTPGGPQGPRRKVTAITGVVLAVIAAVLAALIAEGISRRRRPDEEIRARFGLPVLGEIPVIPDADRPIAEIVKDPDSSALEALISLRTNLNLALERGRGRTVCVTSARAGEGRSTTALSLAWALSELGLRAVLLEADLRGPSLTPRVAGLEYSGGDSSLTPALLDPRTPSLRFVSAADVEGTDTEGARPHPADLVAARLPTMLGSLEAVGVVVVDAPQITTPETTLLMRMTSWTVIVLDTRRRGAIDSLESTIDSVRAADSEVLGVVLNHVRKRRLRGEPIRRQDGSAPTTLSAEVPGYQRSSVS
jgi:Mrp family chromosome partitioning ATPase/capsular polysaccharide biosynthesis protein